MPDTPKPETYRVLYPITLYTTGQTVMPGGIVELSHMSDEGIKQLLRQRIVETADGEPVNTATIMVRTTRRK